jgi:hypothetical protein
VGIKRNHATMSEDAGGSQEGSEGTNREDEGDSESANDEPSNGNISPIFW